MILNGVCIRWRGWLDLERLDGVGCLEFDEENAMVEDAKLREQVRVQNILGGWFIFFWLKKIRIRMLVFIMTATASTPKIIQKH